MIDFKIIADKWQKKWEEDKTFEVEINDYSKKKYFLTTPYPYMSGLLHLGHLFTYNAPETIARFKRMQGHNVLFKFAFHCTGTPIVAAAKKVAENEPKQISALKKMGIGEEIIPKFKDPIFWTEYFPKETIQDVKKMGYVIDDRYSFMTTSLNSPYDSMIRWQFNKLKEKGYVKKGKHPVVWCPKDNMPVGDHDRNEGEGETPKDFIWGKFRMTDSDLILMAGTTRPDAFLGQTHVWIDPKGEYVVVNVNEEKWVVGKEAVKKIEDQFGTVAVEREITPKEIIGKWVRGPLVDYDIYIVPAWFIDSKVGSGIVYSALEDPVDLVEIIHIQSNLEMIEEFGLDLEVIKKLKPISIIDVSGLSDNLGQDMIDKYKITSPDETKKVKDAKDELNKVVFRKGVMKDNCGKYKGMTVPDAQEVIKKDIIESNEAVMFYELTDKVVCRCLTECVIKMVSDQWFIEYNDPDWKKITHTCLDKLTLWPNTVRKQFDYVLDWLNHWACTREYGLGTKLPWDEKWVIESLSDSTFQMAYCTIAKYLQNPSKYGFSVDKLNDSFFDYVFLERGELQSVVESTGISEEMIEQMKKDFLYWYPFDFRNSAKDLVQNHLSFTLFNHTAVFPEKHWPKGYLINGRIMVNNEKMSKSKGNFFTMRELYKEHGPDIVRLTSANAGEGVDDANYDMSFLSTAKKKLSDFFEFMTENYEKGREDTKHIDEWFIHKINEAIIKTTKALESMMFKSAVQYSFMEMQKNLKWYLNRTGNKPNKKIVTQFIETQIKMLTPFVPHFCEECWEKIGKEKFVSNASWPEKKGDIDQSLDYGEEFIRNTMADIRTVLKLAKVDKPKKIRLFISAEWKYNLFDKVKDMVDKNPGEVLKEIMKDKELKKYGQGKKNPNNIFR